MKIGPIQDNAAGCELQPTAVKRGDRRPGHIARRDLISAIGGAGFAGFFPIDVWAKTTDVVETANGKIRGQTVGPVQVFKGVRYGATTGGTNRFRPPQPVEKWAGVRDAFTPGYSAPQLITSHDPLFAWYEQIEPVSEDCLFLNIFTPFASHAARRPVMVWLHGGAWAQGAGTAPGFDGSRLAHEEDVVVVTINHRLNLFGFIWLDDRDEQFGDSTNAGVLDMIAALRWVRDNIAAFGGDPTNITAFGQSGGGAKVTSLLAASSARDLLHKGIAQSCSGSLRLTEPEEAARLAHDIARKLGLGRPTGRSLQEVPVARLLGAMSGTRTAHRPIIDDRTFARHPFDPDPAASAVGIPLMIGNVATEARWTMARDPRSFLLNAADVKERVARLLHLQAADADRVIEAYRDATPAASPSDLLSAIGTDYVYVRNTRREALLQSQQAPVFTYLFDWRTPVMGGVLRSPHAVELPFLFGTTAVASNFVGTGADLEPMRRITMATWAGFARSGNPANRFLPRWPQYGQDRKAVMVLNRESRVEDDPGAQARAALNDLRWYEYSMPVSYSAPIPSSAAPQGTHAERIGLDA